MFQDNVVNQLYNFYKRTNYISNRLGGGLTLILYCKSKNNDFRVRTLAPDSSWSFDFRPNIFGTTLFYCRLMWAREAHSFDIYND